MTELEAQRIIDEARSKYPVFIEGRQRFQVPSDGRVGVWLAVGKSGRRWKSDCCVEGTSIWLPKRVRERAADEVRRGNQIEGGQ